MKKEDYIKYAKKIVSKLYLPLHIKQGTEIKKNNNNIASTNRQVLSIP